MRVDPRCGAAHDRSDEPRTHASAGPTPQRRFHKLRRGLQSGGAEKQLVLSSSERLKPGQNSPCSTHPHPNRDKTLPAQAKRPEFHVFGRAGGILSRKCPNVRALGEFCPGRRSEAATPGTFCPAISCTLARSPTGSYVHRLLHRWAGTTHGASEAWLRCPWAVAGPGRASRSITPSRRLACGDLAGGPPPTGTHSSPATARAHKAARRLHGHTQQPGGCTGTHSSPAVATGSPRAHKATRWLHGNATRPRPVSRPRPRE